MCVTACSALPCGARPASVAPSRSISEVSSATSTSEGSGSSSCGSGIASETIEVDAVGGADRSCRMRASRAFTASAMMIAAQAAQPAGASHDHHTGLGDPSAATASLTRRDRWSQKSGDGSGTSTSTARAIAVFRVSSSVRHASQVARCRTDDSDPAPSARSTSSSGLRCIYIASSPSSFFRLPSA